MTSRKFTLKGISQFFTDGIWAIEQDSLPRIPRWALWVLRRLVVTIECFIHNNLTSYAAALTYNCILAAVPVLAVIFAIGRGFGFDSVLEERIRENIHADDRMMADMFGFINHYLDYTHTGIFVGVGVIIMVYTIVMFTSNIETAFNTIWHVGRSRNIYRQAIGYAAIIFLLPLLIVVTSGFSVFLFTMVDQFSEYKTISDTMEMVIKGTPVAISCVCFVLLYKVMPNTNVRWWSVVAPGILAGCLFQGLQYFYINYQLMITSYNAIYGSFAALPLFALWLQFSWYICLFFAQMSYAIQHNYDYIFAKNNDQLSRLDRDTLALVIMALVARRFQHARPACGVNDLVEESQLPHALVQSIAYELTAANLLCEVSDQRGTDTLYMPAMDISRMTVNSVLRTLDSHGRGHVSPIWAREHQPWRRLRAHRERISVTNGDTPITDIL